MLGAGLHRGRRAPEAPLPDRRVSTYVQSHFFLDEFPQSTEPLDENPRPHTQLSAQLEDDYVSAVPGQTLPTDEATRRDGFDAPRPPPTTSSSVSGRLGEAALRGGEAIVAAGAAGVGQAVERFGFRNAERAAAQVEQRVLPQIIGRPADAEQLIMRAGQRAQEVQRAAATDIEQFAAEQAAAETAEITPLLLAEMGGLAAAAAGAAEALGRSCSRRRARGSSRRRGRGRCGIGARRGCGGRSLPGRKVHARRRRRRRLKRSEFQDMLTSSLTRRVPTKLAVVRKYLLSFWAWVMKPPVALAMATRAAATAASICAVVLYGTKPLVSVLV